MSDNGFKPPTMAFATFWHFIEGLSEKPHPPQIDRSLMGNKSGTDQTKLMNTLKEFGLIGEDLVVLPALRQLATADVDRRRAELADILRKYYPSAIELSAQEGTHQQLQDCFRADFQLETSADSRRKAITFFLHAATEAGVHVSANFTTPRPTSGAAGAARPRRPKNARKQAGGVKAADVKSDHGPGDQTGTAFSTEVRMKAGTVRLTADINPIELRGEDRAFFYDLIDRMDEHGARSEPPRTASEGYRDGGDEEK